MITTLHLGLSYRCNFSCAHCYVHKAKDALTLPQYQAFLSAADRRGLLLVLYTFGEPLLADKLMDMTAYVHSLGISQTILTNGWYVNGETVDRLAQNGVTSYQVSLDSTIPSIHDANRGCAGAYDRAIRAIRVLKDRKMHVGINVTVTRQNQDALGDFLTLAEREGADRISFLAERRNGKLEGELSEEYLRVFRYAMARSQGGKIFFHDPRLLRHAADAYRQGVIDGKALERWQQMNGCHSGVSLSLEPNGDLYRCNLCRQTLLTNIASCEDMNTLLSERDGRSHEDFVCCSMLSKADQGVFDPSVH